MAQYVAGRASGNCGLSILMVLFVSGVLNFQFRPLAYTQTILDHRGLLPFWHYYIVSKAHAAESFVVHAVTFAPVGMWIWLPLRRNVAQVRYWLRYWHWFSRPSWNSLAG